MEDEMREFREAADADNQWERLRELLGFSKSAATVYGREVLRQAADRIERLSQEKTEALRLGAQRVVALERQVEELRAALANEENEYDELRQGFNTLDADHAELATAHRNVTRELEEVREGFRIRGEKNAELLAATRALQSMSRADKEEAKSLRVANDRLRKELRECGAFADDKETEARNANARVRDCEEHIQGLEATLEDREAEIRNLRAHYASKIGEPDTVIGMDWGDVEHASPVFHFLKPHSVRLSNAPDKPTHTEDGLPLDYSNPWVGMRQRVPIDHGMTEDIGAPMEAQGDTHEDQTRDQTNSEIAELRSTIERLEDERTRENAGRDEVLREIAELERTLGETRYNTPLDAVSAAIRVVTNLRNSIDELRARAGMLDRGLGRINYQLGLAMGTSEAEIERTVDHLKVHLADEDELRAKLGDARQEVRSFKAIGSLFQLGTTVAVTPGWLKQAIVDLIGERDSYKELSERVCEGTCVHLEQLRDARSRIVNQRNSIQQLQVAYERNVSGRELREVIKRLREQIRVSGLAADKQLERIRELNEWRRRVMEGLGYSPGSSIPSGQQAADVAKGFRTRLAEMDEETRVRRSTPVIREGIDEELRQAKAEIERLREGLQDRINQVASMRKDIGRLSRATGDYSSPFAPESPEDWKRAVLAGYDLQVGDEDLTPELATAHIKDTLEHLRLAAQDRNALIERLESRGQAFEDLQAKVSKLEESARKDARTISGFSEHIQNQRMTIDEKREVIARLHKEVGELRAEMDNLSEIPELDEDVAIQLILEIITATDKTLRQQAQEIFDVLSWEPGDEVIEHREQSKRGRSEMPEEYAFGGVIKQFPAGYERHMGHLDAYRYLDGFPDLGLLSLKAFCEHFGITEDER